MTPFKDARLFGKNEDGAYLGRIEEILSGAPLKIRGMTLIGEKPDVLCVSNRHDPAWVFSLLTGYRQLGTYKVERPHLFREGGDVVVTMRDDRIVDVVGAMRNTPTKIYSIPPSMLLAWAVFLVGMVAAIARGSYWGLVFFVLAFYTAYRLGSTDRLGWRRVP